MNNIFDFKKKKKTLEWKKNEISKSKKIDFNLPQVPALEPFKKRCLSFFGFDYFRHLFSAIKTKIFLFPQDFKILSNNSLLIFWKIKTSSRVSAFFSIKLLVGGKYFNFKNFLSPLNTEKEKEIFFSHQPKKDKLTLSTTVFKGIFENFRGNDKNFLFFLISIEKKV